MNGTVNKPRGVAFVGDVKDVCNELKNEVQRCKNMTVEQYIRFRYLEAVVAKQIAEIEARHSARQRR